MIFISDKHNTPNLDKQETIIMLRQAQYDYIVSLSLSKAKSCQKNKKFTTKVLTTLGQGITT